MYYRFAEKISIRCMEKFMNRTTSASLVAPNAPSSKGEIASTYPPDYAPKFESFDERTHVNANPGQHGVEEVSEVLDSESPRAYVSERNTVTADPNVQDAQRASEFSNDLAIPVPRDGFPETVGINPSSTENVAQDGSGSMSESSSPLSTSGSTCVEGPLPFGPGDEVSEMIKGGTLSDPIESVELSQADELMNDHGAVDIIEEVVPRSDADVVPEDSPSMSESDHDEIPQASHEHGILVDEVHDDISHVPVENSSDEEHIEHLPEEHPTVDADGHDTANAIVGEIPEPRSVDYADVPVTVHVDESVDSFKAVSGEFKEDAPIDETTKSFIASGLLDISFSQREYTATALLGIITLLWWVLRRRRSPQISRCECVDIIQQRRATKLPEPASQSHHGHSDQHINSIRHQLHAIQSELAQLRAERDIVDRELMDTSAQILQTISEQLEMVSQIDGSMPPASFSSSDLLRELQSPEPLLTARHTKPPPLNDAHISAPNYSHF